MGLPEGYNLHYCIRNHDLDNPARDIQVLATPQEIKQLVEEGYFVREGFLEKERLECLRLALDKLAQVERNISGGGEGMSYSRQYGGLFLRHLADKDPEFLALVRSPKLISIAQAVFGPQVQTRGFTARITSPDEPNQETHWHFHQRLIPDPLPPWFTRPLSLDILIYLDEINDSNGPLCVVPGSHNWTTKDLPKENYEILPGQVALKPKAGDAVFCSGSIWHRAMPNTSKGTLRRLLLLGYGPSWLKPSIYGAKPENGLTSQVLKDADEETKELFGASGWM
jgi:ectoine hydroxylase-related dioxygenase (phytanoyl-CoA dioxygenase family)